MSLDPARITPDIGSFHPGAFVLRLGIPAIRFLEALDIEFQRFTIELTFHIPVFPDILIVVGPENIA